jgi:hypothetical protein
MSKAEYWPWVVSPRKDRNEHLDHVSHTDPNVGERWHPPTTPPVSQAPEVVRARTAEHEAKRRVFFEERGPVPPELVTRPVIPLSPAERSELLGGRIRRRREALGQTHEDTDWVIGPDSSYGDIWEEEYVTYAAELGVLRRVCAFLRLEPLELLELKCAFHEGHLPYLAY